MKRERTKEIRITGLSILPETSEVVRELSAEIVG